MPTFIVRVESIKWLCYVTDTKRQAERLALDTVRSGTMDWADGLVKLVTSQHNASEENEIKGRKETDAWKKQLKQMKK